VRLPGRILHIEALDDLATEFLADKPLVSLDLTIGKDGPVRRVGLYWETPVAHPDDANLTRLCRRVAGLAWARQDRWDGLMTWLEAKGRDARPTGRRSFTLKLIVEPDAPPALKAYVSNFDELGVFPKQPANDCRTLPRDGVPDAQ
jgi:hypothetical protein